MDHAGRRVYAGRGSRECVLAHKECARTCRQPALQGSIDGLPVGVAHSSQTTGEVKWGGPVRKALGAKGGGDDSGGRGRAPDSGQHGV